MKIIEGEFERPVSQVFSYISDEPVASASFGQVIFYPRSLPSASNVLEKDCLELLIYSYSYYCTISIRFIRGVHLMVLLWP